jgi:hypothetical protein
LLTAVLATLSGLLTLLSRFRLPAAALLPALTSLLARLLFIRIHNCSFESSPLPTTNLPGSSSPAASVGKRTARVSLHADSRTKDSHANAAETSLRLSPTNVEQLRCNEQMRT